MKSPRSFIALDLETTGLAAQVDRIVEIGAIRFLETGEELARFQTLVNPGCLMPAQAMAVHGISDADLAEAPSIADVLPHFLDFLGDPGDAILMAHHSSFDAGFLGAELARSGLPRSGYFLVDTLALARRKLPHLRTHRLESLALLLGLDCSGRHRALADSHRVKDLWLNLGGPAEEDDKLVAYPMIPRSEPSVVPRGWEVLKSAAARGTNVRIEYDGGSLGSAPRTITPRSFQQRGGCTYVIAFCHIGLVEKSFRLDRIRSLELIVDRAACSGAVDATALEG
jgi:DNA polymerase III epsilon subunit family exonuclease